MEQRYLAQLANCSDIVRVARDSRFQFRLGFGQSSFGAAESPQFSVCPRLVWVALQGLAEQFFCTCFILYYRTAGTFENAIRQDVCYQDPGVDGIRVEGESLLQEANRGATHGRSIIEGSRANLEIQDPGPHDEILRIGIGRTLLLDAMLYVPHQFG